MLCSSVTLCEHYKELYKFMSPTEIFIFLWKNKSYRKINPQKSNPRNLLPCHMTRKSEFNTYKFHKTWILTKFFNSITEIQYGISVNSFLLLYSSFHGISEWHSIQWLFPIQMIWVTISREHQIYSHKILLSLDKHNFREQNTNNSHKCFKNQHL